MAKNQAKAKQHPEDELLISENYSLCSSTLSSENNRRYSKKRAKTSACFNRTIRLIVKKMGLKMKNRSHR